MDNGKPKIRVRRFSNYLSADRPAMSNIAPGAGGAATASRKFDGGIRGMTGLAARGLSHNLLRARVEIAQTTRIHVPGFVKVLILIGGMIGFLAGHQFASTHQAEVKTVLQGAKIGKFWSSEGFSKTPKARKN
jgi:hypothetical protein